MAATRPTEATVQLVIKRDEGRCAACGDEIYGMRGWDWSVQHRRPAGMGGDPRPETHAAGNLVLLHGHGTSLCHGDVESRRADAQKKGLLIPKESVDPPSQWAIEHAVHGWCYLLDDGSVSYEPAEVAA